MVDNDPRLNLWGFAAKGYTDIEINAPTAKQDWGQVLTLAWQASDKKWISRAQGELGIITFLEGDWKWGAWLVRKPYFETSSAGDIGSEIRYLQFIGAARNEVNTTASPPRFRKAGSSRSLRKFGKYPFKARTGRKIGPAPAIAGQDASGSTLQGVCRVGILPRDDH